MKKFVASRLTHINTPKITFILSSQLHDSTDVYFLQLHDPSWGQVFTYNQWQEFKRWWSLNSYNSPSENLPNYILENWTNSSWKRHFALII
jgi:hypothetical protein